MNTKIKAGLLLGAMMLTAGLSVPAQAQSAYQNYLNQLYWNSQYNLYNSQVGAYGLNPNDPNYFRQAQIIQWQQSQPGGGMISPAYNPYHGGVYTRWHR